MLWKLTFSGTFSMKILKLTCRMSSLTSFEVKTVGLQLGFKWLESSLDSTLTVLETVSETLTGLLESRNNF